MCVSSQKSRGLIDCTDMEMRFERALALSVPRLQNVEIFEQGAFASAQRIGGSRSAAGHHRHGLGYCERSGTRGRTVTLKIKFANFRQITRSRTGQMPVSTRSELEQLGNALLEPLFPIAKGIRLLGISLSSLLTGERDDKRKAADL